MRIQYSPSISVFLSVLITVSACQGDAHRMYMDNSDYPATNQFHKAHDASVMSLEVITDTLPVVHPKEASVETSPATPSPSSSGGSPMSAQISPIQGIEAPIGTKSKEVISQEATDRQAAPKYSSEDHENWFHEFVNAVDNAEEWDEITSVLDKGKPLGYLTQSIGWDDDRYTPLHYAAEEGAIDVVQELIEARNIPVDIRTGECKRTPLHLAALAGHLDIVKYLIGNGATQDASDTDGSNVLHYAASGVKQKDNTTVTSYLIEELNVDPKSLVKDKFNVLHLAIKAANTDLVRYFVQKIPELVSMKTNSVSPLVFARTKHETAIVDIIQKKLEEE